MNGRTLRTVVLALVAIRVLVLVIVLADRPVTDPWLLRAERIASSPATPYLHFPVSMMPLQTAAIEVLGGGGVAALATKVALVAFAADLAAAWALTRARGRGAAAAYLVLGLPLLPLLYARLNLVAVALACAGVWLLTRRRSPTDDAAAGGLLALATLWGLWPAALLPAWWARAQRRGLLVAAGVVAVVGGAWYLWGGRKGPFQVLSTADALGWSIHSTIGNLLWILTGGTPVPEGGAMRVGIAPTSVKVVLLACMAATLYLVWRDHTRDPEPDPFGGPALAAVAAVLVFAPVAPLAHAVWLAPWAAVALQGGRWERRVANLAGAAIVLTGLLALADPDRIDGLVRWGVLARNLCEVVLVLTWLTRPAPRPATAASATASA